jgi:hypothetical protein
VRSLATVERLGARSESSLSSPWPYSDPVGEHRVVERGPPDQDSGPGYVEGNSSLRFTDLTRTRILRDKAAPARPEGAVSTPARARKVLAVEVSTRFAGVTGWRDAAS